MPDILVRRLPGDRLHELCDGDPFVRWDLARPHVGDIWTAADAVAIERLSHSRRIRSLTVLGGQDATGVRALLDQAAVELPADLDAVSVDQRHLAQLQMSFAGRLATGGDWHWMWTTQVPAPSPAEDRLIALDDRRDAAEIVALNEVGNPTAESEPGSGLTLHWLGARDGGRLVAAGAVHTTSAGTPHLTGIVVDPRMRGTGLGIALISALTRWGVQRHGVSTLGVYADNARAIGIYERLGYVSARHWASRRLT